MHMHEIKDSQTTRARATKKLHIYTRGVQDSVFICFLRSRYCSILAKQPEGFWNFFCLDTTSISLSLLINISFFVSSFLLPFYLKEKKKEGNRKKRRHPASASRRTSNGSGYIYISLYCFHTHTHTHSLSHSPPFTYLPTSHPPSLSLLIHTSLFPLLVQDGRVFWITTEGGLTKSARQPPLFLFLFLSLCFFIRHCFDKNVLLLCVISYHFPRLYTWFPISGIFL